MIEPRNLFKLQSKLTVNKKSIPVKTLEKDYILTWILAEIAKLDMENLFVFKGGTSLKKFYIENYRFSEDLDFTLLNPLTLEELEEKMEEIIISILDEANIPVAINRSEKHSNSYIIYINFSGPLGADISRGEVKIDFTLNELLLFPIKRKKFFELYEEYNDVPRNAEILVYSVEEIFVEKIISLLDPKRNEPRDIYDLWFLLDNDYIQLALLKGQIIEKSKFKEIEDINILHSLDNKKGIYERLWMNRLSYQVLNLPHFDHVYRSLKRILRQLK